MERRINTSRRAFVAKVPLYVGGIAAAGLSLISATTPAASSCSDGGCTGDCYTSCHGCTATCGGSCAFDCYGECVHSGK